MIGKVKWFSDKLGYGYINSKEVENDIYIHYSDIKMDGFKYLNEGDEVKFIFDPDFNKAVCLEVVKRNKKYNDRKHEINNNLGGRKNEKFFKERKF